MRSLLDVLARAGVERAGAEKRWPADVVTKVLRDHPGELLPIRHDMTKAQARAVTKKLEGETTGMWDYHCMTRMDENRNYTVFAYATRSRASKFATDGGEDTEGDK